jgi:hypothetical protein
MYGHFTLRWRLLSLNTALLERPGLFAGKKNNGAVLCVCMTDLA